MPKLSSNLKLDFENQTIIHNSITPFLYNGDNSPVVNAHISNLTLIVQADTKFCIWFIGFRECIFENIRIKYEGDPLACTALMCLQSGDMAPNGPGGCHKNTFRNITLKCNGAKRGLLIRKSGSQRCNNNKLYNIDVIRHSLVGIDIKECIGNMLFAPTCEGDLISIPKFGILFRNGHHNFAFGSYVENAEHPLWKENEPSSAFYGGYTRP